MRATATLVVYILEKTVDFLKEVLISPANDMICDTRRQFLSLYSLVYTGFTRTTL